MCKDLNINKNTLSKILKELESLDMIILSNRNNHINTLVSLKNKINGLKGQTKKQKNSGKDTSKLENELKLLKEELILLEENEIK